MFTFEKGMGIALAVLALFYSVTGIALYFFPEPTFSALPVYYGVFNLHFIKDAGLAFLSSGVMLCAATINLSGRVNFACCAALFVVLHGLFHVQMLFSGMIPGDFIAYEFMQVILPALFLLILVAVLVRRRGECHDRS